MHAQDVCSCGLMSDTGWPAAPIFSPHAQVCCKQDGAAGPDQGAGGGAGGAAARQLCVPRHRAHQGAATTASRRLRTALHACIPAAADLEWRKAAGRPAHGSPANPWSLHCPLHHCTTGRSLRQRWWPAPSWRRRTRAARWWAGWARPVTWRQRWLSLPVMMRLTSQAKPSWWRAACRAGCEAGGRVCCLLLVLLHCLLAPCTPAFHHQAHPSAAQSAAPCTSGLLLANLGAASIFSFSQHPLQSAGTPPHSHYINLQSFAL